MRILVFWMVAVLMGGSAMGAAENWHEDAFFGLHYDHHARENDTELGRETTAGHIREQLGKVKPDFVQYDCKGHPGWASYPTKVGSASPGIQNDMLRVWREVTREMGIPLSIHFSGVWDTRAVELHPEWARVDENGKAHSNYTCPLSAYTEELMIPQLLEVVRDYEIDGMWIDGENWASCPCYCERCQAAFKEKTGFEEVPRKAGEAHWEEWLAFQRSLFVAHVKKYADAVHAENPGVLVCSNWMYSVRQPDAIEAPVDYLSGDFDPSFGAERACAEARFLSSRGKPWDLMAWSFLRTGDEGWTMKTAPHLCQEVSEVLGQGGAVFIYNTPQRTGRLTSWHQDLLGEVANFCRQRQEWCHKTETVPQVAILHSQSYYYRHNAPLFNFGEGNRPMEGALHAMLENGYSADILNEEMFLGRMAAYPVVVVPEQAGLPQAVVDGLRSYVEGGGRLLVSGAHVAGELGSLAGVEAAEGQQGTSWVPAGNGCVTVNGPWQNVKVAGAVELAPLMNQQELGLNLAGTPAMTKHTVGQGTVVAIHGPVFEDYHTGHYPGLRRFIGDALGELDARGMIRVHGPWWVEMAARKRDGQMLLQFVNRSCGGYTAPNRHHVEHVSDAGPFTVTVPLPERPKRCFMAPEKEGLEWTWKDGVLTAEVGGLGIHNVMVIE